MVSEGEISCSLPPVCFEDLGRLSLEYRAFIYEHFKSRPET